MSAMQQSRTSGVPPYDEVELLRRVVEARFGRRPLAASRDQPTVSTDPIPAAGRSKGEDKGRTR
jgi:hypothetical protein